jgi:DNA polymerase III epsilon subunit-like protein
MNTEHLLITPSHKIELWKKLVEKKLEEGEQIVVIADTETTGGVMKGKGCSVLEKEDKAFMKQRHRIVELGAIICTFNKKKNTLEPIVDPEGDSIFFQEYLNFLNEEDMHLNKYVSIREMPEGAWFVHGISMKFLDGKEMLGESLATLRNQKYGVPLPENHGKTLRLPSSAPTFEQVIEPFLAICGLQYPHEDKPTTGRVVFMAHNHEFDAKFMNAEMQNAGYSTIESITEPRDSIVISKGLFKPEYIKSYKEQKRKEMHDELKLKNLSESQIKYEIDKKIPNGLFSLDSLCYLLTERGLMNQEGIDRTLHGAALDCEILRRVYQGLLSSEEYQNSPNRPNIDNECQIEKSLLKIGENGGVRKIKRPCKELKSSRILKCK